MVSAAAEAKAEAARKLYVWMTGGVLLCFGMFGARNGTVQGSGSLTNLVLLICCRDQGQLAIHL